MKPRLLAISIDAPAWPLLRRWMDAGELPVLARLRRRGAVCSLRAGESHLPDTDIEALWTGDPFDAVESYALGRVGPVPYRRAGGHTTEGFILTCRRDLVPGEYPQRPPLDVAPTLLDLVGLEPARPLDGMSMLPQIATLAPRDAA